MYSFGQAYVRHLYAGDRGPAPQSTFDSAPEHLSVLERQTTVGWQRGAPQWVKGLASYYVLEAVRCGRAPTRKTCERSPYPASFTSAACAMLDPGDRLLY